MPTGRGRWLASLLACSFPLACGASSGGGSTGGGDPAASAAAAICAEWFRCGCYDFATEYDTEADCETHLAAQIQAVLDEGEARGLTFDADCIDRGVAAIESYDCAAVSSFTQGELAAMSSGCFLFHGDAPMGAACEPLAMGGGSECVASLQCIAGTCQAALDVVGVGEACAMAICDTGLACVDGSCAAAPGAGEACATGSGGPHNQCGTGLHCEDASSTCQPRAAAGEPCEPLGCVPGHICPGGTCEAQAPAVCL